MYRVKQFIWAIKSIFEKVDYTFIDRFLNKDEKDLFDKLSKSDKHHSIRVAKDAIEILNSKSKYIDLDLDKVVKVSLLHDIGKISRNLNIIEKSTIVILNKVTKGKLKRYKYIKSIDVYYNHPKKGRDLLKKFDIYDKEFLDSIRYHHEENDENNLLLEIIKESDNKN